MECDDGAFEGGFDGFNDDGSAGACFGREDEDVDGEDVAAHFLLTASSVCELAAEALFENSEICCDAGLDVEVEGVMVVEVQL